MAKRDPEAAKALADAFMASANKNSQDGNNENDELVAEMARRQRAEQGRE